MRRIGWVVTAAAVLAGRAPAVAPVPAGLAAHLAYPFLEPPVASADGRRIAWVRVQSGIRSIWTAAAPGWTPARLFSTDRDDGQELTGLAISGDGRTLAWTRGGDHDGNWEAAGKLQPDPAGTGPQPGLELWVARDGAAPARLGEGDAPALSATGRLAWLRDGAVWTVGADGKPARAFFDRGHDRDLRWSPDGTRLLFTSGRDDHAFIGIWSGDGRPLRWLAPSTGRDTDATWSPDGTRVAFARRPGDGGPPAPLAEEVPQPWGLWVADAATGEGRRLWAAPATPDWSWPEVPGGLFLRWAAGDRLLFRAEGDGWPHLYALRLAGGPPVTLTPGAYMVDRPVLAPGGATVLFDANGGATPGDGDRRHLFRVGVDRPGAVALTAGTGIETGAAPVAGGAVAFLSATATRPPSLHLRADGRERALDDDAAAYPADRLVVPRPVTFRAADGLTVHGQLFQAPGAGPKPGIVFVHGGPPRQMLLGWSYMEYYANAYAVNQWLATHGFTVLAVNYRLGIGYGRAYQHPAHAGPAGSSEYQDVVAGARFLGARADVDPRRIGIWGGSYGGLLTALALARNSDLFRAGVDFHGVHDWSLALGQERSRPVGHEQGDWDRAMRIAFDSSPVAAVAGWRSPALLIHGDDDRNVRFDQTISLARRLDALGRPYEELVLPDEIHGFLTHAAWLRADAATIDFFERGLRP